MKLVVEQARRGFLARLVATEDRRAENQNLAKRYKIAADCFNVSLLMRSLLGVGPQNNGWQGPLACLKPFIAYLCWGVLRFRSLCLRTPTFTLVFPNLLRTQVAA